MRWRATCPVRRCRRARWPGYALGAPLPGIPQPLGTVGELFRHYWVLVKLVINPLSALILPVHIRPIDAITGTAVAAPIIGGDHLQVRLQMAVASGLAVLALLVATVLASAASRHFGRPTSPRTRNSTSTGAGSTLAHGFGSPAAGGWHTTPSRSRVNSVDVSARRPGRTDTRSLQVRSSAPVSLAERRRRFHERWAAIMDELVTV